jgi:hypothetical protein
VSNEHQFENGFAFMSHPGTLAPTLSRVWAALLVALIATGATAAEEKPTPAKPQAPARPSRDDQEYCGAVVKVASAAKIAAQEAHLREMEADPAARRGARLQAPRPRGGDRQI